MSKNTSKNEMNDSNKSKNIMELYFQNNCTKDESDNKSTNLANKNNVMQKDNRERKDGPGGEN